MQASFVLKWLATIRGGISQSNMTAQSSKIVEFEKMDFFPWTLLDEMYHLECSD